MNIFNQLPNKPPPALPFVFFSSSFSLRNTTIHPPPLPRSSGPSLFDANTDGPSRYSPSRRHPTGFYVRTRESTPTPGSQRHERRTGYRCYLRIYYGVQQAGLYNTCTLRQRRRSRALCFGTAAVGKSWKFVQVPYMHK